MKVSYILKGPKDQYGRTRVYIRVNDKLKRRFYPTNIRTLSLEKLSPSEKSVLKTLILKHETGYTKEKKAPVKFSVYVINCIRQWPHKKASTLSQINTELNKFIQYQDPYIGSISHETLQGYLDYLRTTGVQTNTIWKSFKFLKTVIKKAYREGLIESDPFLLFDSPKYKDPPRQYLSRAEVERIEKVEGDLRHAALWFVIACYTGLRFSDLSGFDKSRIKNNRLVVYTAKTGEIVSIPLLPKIRELLEQVNYKPLNLTNQAFNRTLKAIAVHAKVKENLTAHLARHTCAVLLADAGVSIEVTAKILGQSSIRTTAIYYKITNKRIDDELGRIF
jgi:site-specific recombinase XerD